jgi:hypothetical protein
MTELTSLATLTTKIITVIYVASLQTAYTDLA